MDTIESLGLTDSITDTKLSPSLLFLSTLRVILDTGALRKNDSEMDELDVETMLLASESDSSLPCFGLIFGKDMYSVASVKSRNESPVVC